MSVPQFEELSLIFGVGGLILYMLFIIWRLGVESGAGRFGYAVLFGALGLGLFGFVAKTVLVELIGL